MANNVLLSDPHGLDEIIPEDFLIDSDGVPMETPWHFRAMSNLIESAEHHFQGRDDYYTAGNMFLYYSPEQARNKDFRGPDFFFVWNTNHLPDRRFWYVWEEKRTPNVVIELSSPSTREEDHTVKKDIYEQILRVADYYCFDPDGNILEGWRLHGREYVTLSPNEKGWLWCEELQLWVGAWQGQTNGYESVYPRFFDTEGNLVMTGKEAGFVARDAAEVRLDVAIAARDVAFAGRDTAFAARDSAFAALAAANAEKETAQSLVEHERIKAAGEKRRAEAAERELASLRERIALLEKGASVGS